MIIKTIDSCNPCVRDICVFLAEYSAHLLASGATCVRLDKNVRRIAASYGVEVEMTVMPRHIHLTVQDCETGAIQTSIASVHDTGANFTVNTELSRLSWSIVDEKIVFPEAVERFEAIIRRKNQNPWLTLLLVSIANACFCRLFGGDWTAMLIVAIATCTGFFLKSRLMARKMDIRTTFIICAFISSLIGAADMFFSLGTTPAIALGTSVLYLVPGIPFLNSFSDMLYRHYLIAFSRFFDAVILTCCLSLGMCLAVWLVHASIF